MAPISDPPDHLVRALAYGHLVVFAGSTLGSPRSVGQLKKALAHRLRDLDDEDARASDLLDIAEWFEGRFGREALIACVREALSEIDPLAGRVHERLARLSAREIIRSAWDDLAERALRRAGRSINVIVPDQTMTFGPTGPLPVLKLNGDLSEPARLVITRRDDEEYARRFPTIRRHLEDLAATSTFLFLGTELKDASFSRVWGAVGDALREAGRPSYALVRRPSPHLVEQWRGRRVNVLRFDDEGDLLTFLDTLAERAKAALGGPDLSAEALDRAPFEAAWRAFVYKRHRHADTAGLFQFQRTVYRRDVERREIYVEPVVRPQREERERGCPACGRPGGFDPAEGSACGTKGCPREGKGIPELGSLYRSGLASWWRRGQAPLASCTSAFKSTWRPGTSKRSRRGQSASRCCAGTSTSRAGRRCCGS